MIIQENSVEKLKMCYMVLADTCTDVPVLR